MQSKTVRLILQAHRRIEAMQLALFRAVLEQPEARKRLRWAILALLLFYAALSLTASAEESMLQLNAIDSKFQALQNTWYSVVKGFASSLFWKLAVIDFGWSAVVYVLEKNEAAEILTSLVRKIITLSFFFSLLRLSDTWIPAIIQSFVTVGKAAAGVGTLTPDGIVNKGLDLALGAFSLLKELNALSAIGVVLPVTFMALLIFLAFLWVAAQLLVTLVESYIAIGLGVILLGFGGSRWTTDFATKYLQFAVGTGIKLMLIYAIVGGGQTLFNGLLIDGDQLVKSLLIVLGTSFVYTYLAINIPQLATAMMSGSPNLTAGGLAGAAATVASAAVGAGVAAAGVGAAAKNGLSQGAAAAGGLSQALGAGLDSAADHGKSGLAAAGHAVREVASHGLGMAAGAAGTGLQNARSAFADRVAQTAGGKIASSIEATRGGSMTGTPAPAPSPAPAPGAGAGSQSSTTGGAAPPAQPGDGSTEAPQTADASASTDAAGQGGTSAPAPASEGTPSGTAQSGTAQVAPSAGTGAASSSAEASGSSPMNAPSAPSGAAPKASAAAPKQSAAPVAPAGAGTSVPATSASGAAPSALSTGSSANNTGSPGPSAAGSSPSAVAAPSAASGTPVSQDSAPSGDASNAAISGDQSPQEDGSDTSRGPSLNERMRALDSYIPQDGAGSAAINIDISHSRD